jgi:hypothetical protein
VNTLRWSEQDILTASAIPAVPPAMMCVAKPTGCLSLEAIEKDEVQGVQNDECGAAKITGVLPVSHGRPIGKHKKEFRIHT